MKYFRHNINERNKSNVIKLRMKHGAAGYGVYMMLLERLAAEPELRSDLDYDMLAYDFHVDSQLIRSVIEDFDLFIIDLDADCFSNEELTAQLTTKARQKLNEDLVDRFISSRLSDTRWIEATASAHKTIPDHVRAVLRTSFRAHVLDSNLRIPDTYRLNALLALHLKSCLKKE